jgi:hypothetical protein
VREPATVRPGQLEDAAARVEDWQEAGNLAGAHRVAAFVRAACRKITQPIPASVDQMLRQASMVAAARVMLLDATLARISRGFAAASVPVTVLKGPALARTIYPRPELRPYGDLDLTIRAHDENAATEILEQFGLHEIPYEAEQARAAHADHVHGASPYHRKFADDSGQVLVELHLDSLQIGMRPTCEAGRWQRAQPLPSMPGVLMLGPEDQLVQLSVHAHKHGFERLIWIKDIDLLLRANGDRLQWSVVRAVAGREGVTSSVWYSVLLAHRILGMPVPPAAMAMLTPPAPVRALYSLLWPPARIAGLKGFSRRRAVQFHAAESWRGMLPSLLLMGRRRTRMRAIVQQLVGR